MDASQRFKIIQPYLEWNIPLSRISREKDIPLRTIQRWVKRYREEGLTGLEHKSRSDKKIYRSVTEEQVKMIRALALEKPRLSITTVYRKIIDLAKVQNHPLPKYDVIYDIIHNMDAGLMTLAHQGSTAYRDKFEIIYRRETSSVNEIWQADHTPLDIFLLTEKGESQKPWLTIIEDDCSRAISGFYLTFEHLSAINTALALRQAIWKKKNPRWQVCGIPQILYTDNGSDFISEHIEKVCISLKIRMINTPPGRPQGKGRVERFFLTLLTKLLERLPGYAPRGFSKTNPKLTLAEFSLKLEDFIITKEHRRFEEFADACEQYRYIGLCYGKPGVGKTCSARYYAKWETVEKHKASESLSVVESQKILGTKALFYTAPITNTPKRIQEKLYRELFQFGNVFAKAQGKTDLKDTLLNVDKQCPLVIIDEADSLTYQSLEQLRHMYDEYGFGLILIGMPGMEKRLSRYPQLYSRIGFSHEYHCLNYDEMEFIFEHHWKNLGLTLDKNEFSDVEAYKPIIRITNGNFRLIQRIFTQINRLQKIS